MNECINCSLNEAIRTIAAVFTTHVLILYAIINYYPRSSIHHSICSIFPIVGLFYHHKWYWL